MLRRVAWVALAIGFVGLVFTRAASAEEQTITGIVRAAAPDAPEAATVRVGDVVYKVTKDDNGRKVATDANGKKAEIKGTVEDRDGVKWITVISAKLVE
jgi:hypothetical protein